MARFARGFRDQRALARAGNEQVHALFGDGKPPQVVYPEHKPRVAKVDDGQPSEHQSQAAVISWWSLACASYELPPFALFAIPNGGARDPITGSRLKQEGVRAGILDLMLAVKRGGFGGLFIEMKKLGNRPSPAQQEVMDYLARAGYARKVCWTSAAAIAAIREYLAGRNQIESP